MLTFRCKIREARFTVEHLGETLRICAVRQEIRRNAPIDVQLRGPESFREAEVTRNGEKWCRLDHAGSSLWIRVCYHATSTSDRFLVTFDAPLEFVIDCVRPVVTTNP